MNARTKHIDVALAVTGTAMAGVALWMVADGLNFAFLSDRANFDIGFSVIAFDTSFSYGRAFLVALLNTLLLAVIAVVLSTVFGGVVGLAQLSNNAVLRGLARAYIEIVRNVPLLLQLLFWYFIIIHMLPPPRTGLALLDTVFLNNRGLYFPAPVNLGVGQFFLIVAAALPVVALMWRPLRKHLGLAFTLSAALVLLTLSIASWSRPALTGFNFAGGTSLNPEFVAIVFALSMYAAAPIGEVVRVGIISVSGGQSEAARTLGLTYLQTVRLVVVPQALRVIILPLGNQYLHLIRNTSLGAAIGFPELMSVFGGTVLNQSGRAIEIVFIMMLTYLGIGLAAGWVMSRLNDSFQIPGRTS